MTATADIFIERKEDILTVPNSALRFDPVAASKVGQEEVAERTIVQQLSPGGGRRWGRGGGGGGAPPTSDAPKKGSRVWVLRDGQPVEIPVATGLTDGSHTEVSGEGLREDLPIIISAKPAVKS